MSRQATGSLRTYLITRDQLESKLGRKTDQWTHHDIAQLEVIFTSLQRGEVTREEEFPAERITEEHLKAPAKPAAPQQELTPEQQAADESWMNGGGQS